jgi:hypothetical protein
MYDALPPLEAAPVKAAGAAQRSGLKETLLLPGISVSVSDEHNLWDDTFHALQTARAERRLGCWGEIIRAERGAGDETSPPIAKRFDSLLGIPGQVRASGRASAKALGPVIDPDGEGSLARTRCFRYRSVRFCVPEDWYGEYLVDWIRLYDDAESVGSDASNGLVSSISDTLDFVWPRFRAASRGDHATFHSLLGCYNLPRNAGGTVDVNDYVFWKSGWGAPHKVYLYACQFLLTYVESAEASFLAECEGISSFIEDLLRGGRAENRLHERCTIDFSFRNTHSGFERVSDSCSVGDEECDLGFIIERRDSGDFKSTTCASKLWSDFDPEFHKGHKHCYGDARDGGDECDLPESGCKSGIIAVGGNFNVTMTPVRLAFSGYVADRILFYARMAKDYAFTGAPDGATWLEFVNYALQLGRYSMRVIADWSRLLIHELGHVYMGEGGHCSVHCCMDVAANRWLCKFRGEHGIPTYADGDYSRLDDLADWDDWVEDDVAHFYIRTRDSCSTDSGFTLWSCDVHENGVAGQDADYCSTVFCIWCLTVGHAAVCYSRSTGDPIVLSERCPDPYD